MPHPPRRPRWSEGLLLSHQHLEEQDRYHEERVDELLRALMPISWGLVDIDIDGAALSRGELNIPRLRAILPDGTPISWGPEGGNLPPRRCLSERGLQSGSRILARIALPAESTGERSLHRRGDEGPPRRFMLGEFSPHRSGTQAPPTNLEVLDLAPLLLLDEETAEGMSTLTVAALRRRSDGGLEIDESYFPPSLQLGAAKGLVRRLRRLLATSTDRRRQLQSECRHREGRIDYRSNDLERHLIVHTLGRIIPPLRDMLEGAPSHPRQAHTLLSELVGELASFLPEGDPAALPIYTHIDASASFNHLLKLANHLIALPLSGEVLTIPLFARGAGLFAAEEIDVQLQRASNVVLAIQSDEGLGRDAGALPELLKVTSGRRIDAIIRSNSRGAPARLLDGPPPSIPAETGAVYLAVDTRDPHWREVLFQRDLAVHLSAPIDTRGLNLRLLALPANGSDHGLATPSRDACA